MSKFVTGNNLNSEIENLIARASEQLIFISPYIKLHHRFRSQLLTKVENHKLEIVIVFGKNDKDIMKSFDPEDLQFLKSFPNIEIRYEKRLHAKYYACEDTAILTSMNLYDFSQDNNIEFGIITKASLFGNLASDTIDNQAFKYFTDTVIPQSELYYKNEPVYKSGIIGFGKSYSHSEVRIDSFKSVKAKTDFIDLKKVTRKGYCIRTGQEIKFNPKRPFTYEAYKEWAKFENQDYPEKFCHFSGEESHGATSFARPVLKKYYAAAKEVMVAQ